MDLGLQGRTYLITGGSRGLGLATAQALVAEGARVLLAARDQEGLDQAVRGLVGPPGESGGAFGLPADLADPTAAERLVAAAQARFGRLDGALISVGGPTAGSALSTTDDAWREAFESVFLGALRMARATAAGITRDSGSRTGAEGSIAMVLSTSVRNPFPGLTISNGLRPGLGMVVKDLADELGPRGIRVNGLLPGRIATDRIFTIDARMGSPEMVRRRNEATIPLGRYGEPEEFGRVAAFVLSPAASYITGSMIPIDGGVLRSL